MIFVDVVFFFLIIILSIFTQTGVLEYLREHVPWQPCHWNIRTELFFFFIQAPGPHGLARPPCISMPLPYSNYFLSLLLLTLLLLFLILYRYWNHITLNIITITNQYYYPFYYCYYYYYHYYYQYHYHYHIPSHLPSFNHHHIPHLPDLKSTFFGDKSPWRIEGPSASRGVG